MGSPGTGTPPHMANELFSRMAQIDVLHVRLGPSDRCPLSDRYWGSGHAAETGETTRM
jgi:hypothetical protein